MRTRRHQAQSAALIIMLRASLPRRPCPIGLSVATVGAVAHRKPDSQLATPVRPRHLLCRPCPIGLSVARVVAVEGRTLVLGGVDVVDGSPILDVKPYVPFSDALPDAAAPGWVAARASGDSGSPEPLELAGVEVPAAADASLAAAWAERCRRRGGSLYRSYAEFRGLVTDVLSRDVRSVTQRVKAPARAAAGLGGLALGSQASSGSGAGAGAAAAAAGAGAAGQQQPPEPAASDGGGGGGTSSTVQALPEGYWHIELDGLDVSYEVLEGGVVQLRTARCVAGGA